MCSLCVTKEEQIKAEHNKLEYRRVDIEVTCALRPLSSLCAALVPTHSATPHLEHCAVSC